MLKQSPKAKECNQLTGPSQLVMALHLSMTNAIQCCIIASIGISRILYKEFTKPHLMGMVNLKWVWSAKSIIKHEKKEVERITHTVD